MDIVDDTVALLRVILDYIGIDLEDIRQILEEINARRRLRFYQTRQAISYNWRCFVIRRQSVRDKIKRIKADVRHQSLMRILGSYLPGKPARRMRIQSHFLESRPTRYMYDSDSDDSVITTTTVGSTTDDDIVWVEEEIGDNCVRVRAEKRRNLEDSDVFNESDEDDIFIARNPLSPMSSTMISSVSSACSVFLDKADQTQKLAAMEGELNNLRQQIAMLVEAQEQTNKSQFPQQSFQEEIVSTPVGSSLPPPGAPPLPPPPPPPPPQILLPPAPPIPTTNQRQIISPILTDKQNTLKTEKSDKSTPTTESQLTLTDVLKGLGNVKLKSVQSLQRSPGGTPMKPKQKRRESNSDPCSVIAQALKKKFANQSIHSPDVDKENDSFWFSSPDNNSPHCLRPGTKKIRKRSIFSDDKKRLSGAIRL